MLKKIIKPLTAGAKLFGKTSITYNFPPETSITKEFRGRHRFDPKKCISCGLCSRICPNKAIKMVERENNGKKVLQPQIDYRKCSFCGLCVDICPTKALTFTNFPMLVTTKKDEFVFPPEKLTKLPELKKENPPRVKSLTDWARSRSLWILNYMTGCCFIEAVPWVSSGFDMERFGLLTVGSARHADVLIVGGYVTLKTLRRIIEIYQQMPNPKFVIALGNCPMSGGTYWDSYNTIKRLDKYIPVDIWIAGCPPRPEAIGLAIVKAMHAIQSGYYGKKEKVKEEESLRVPEYPVFKSKLKTDEYHLPFGPCHPSSGNFDIGFKLEGEIVKNIIPNPGYLHRGFEKLMEYRTWWQNIMLVPRICVLDGASYELGYIGLVEKLAGLNAPKRAKYLRVIQAELSRIQSHLLNLGFISAASGFETVERIAWGEREKILLLLEKLTGGRIYQIYNIPGGVRRDATPSFKRETIKTIKYMRKSLKTLDELFLDNEVFIERASKIGKIGKEEGIENDVTGPNIRASGVKLDIRKSSPYEAYDEVDFQVITSKKGDAYQRTLCRRKEIDESLSIIENALDQLPPGKIIEKKTKDGNTFTQFSSIPEGEAVHLVESARGELCFHGISNGKINPYRIKVRGPTFDTILVMLPKILQGVKLADVPVIYWSLDNCPADHDR